MKISDKGRIIVKKVVLRIVGFLCLLLPRKYGGDWLIRHFYGWWLEIYGEQFMEKIEKEI